MGKQQEALQNLAYLRRGHETSTDVLHELAVIEAAIEEERIARESLGWMDGSILRQGEFRPICHCICDIPAATMVRTDSVAYVISTVPFFVSDAQFVSHYAPQIFASVSFYRWMISVRSFNGLSRLVIRALRTPCLHRVSTGSRKCEGSLFISALESP